MGHVTRVQTKENILVVHWSPLTLLTVYDRNTSATDKSEPKSNSIFYTCRFHGKYIYIYIHSFFHLMLGITARSGSGADASSNLTVSG